MQPDELVELLVDWWDRTDELLGISENVAIEFKSSPHRLDTDKGKLEFAKDVSGMANAGGGLIVIGVRTTTEEALGRDIVTEITPLAPGGISVDQIGSTARDWIYPPVRNIEVLEWSDPDGAMIVGLCIQATPEIDVPAMVRGAEVDGRVNKALTGIAIRHTDRVYYLRADEIHRLVVRGRLGEADLPVEAKPELASAEPDVALEPIRVLYVDDEWPVFLLQAWPASSLRLEHLHDADGIKGVLDEPPTLRNGGFNYRWKQEPAVHGPGGIQVSVGMREGLRIEPTGLVTFFGSAGPGLLGWGMEKYAGPSINPVALAELVFEYARLYSAVLRAGDVQESACFYRIGVPQHSQSLRITSGRRPTGTHVLRELSLEQDVLEQVGPLADGRHREITGALLARFYARFGWGVEHIPYLNQEDGSFNEEILIETEGPGL
ncbi:MAG: ATP-binding protein [Acidimicrobiia bacterium]